MLRNDILFRLNDREKEILDTIKLKNCEFIVKIEETFWKDYGNDVKLIIVMEYSQVCFINILKNLIFQKIMNFIIRKDH